MKKGSFRLQLYQVRCEDVKLFLKFQTIINTCIKNSNSSLKCLAHVRLQFLLVFKETDMGIRNKPQWKSFPLLCPILTLLLPEETRQIIEYHKERERNVFLRLFFFLPANNSSFVISYIIPLSKSSQKPWGCLWCFIRWWACSNCYKTFINLKWQNSNILSD